jgi:hypothetical protein
VIRRGFWKPVYVLTDGQLDYGQLTLWATIKRSKIIETAGGTYRVMKQIGF